MQTKLLCGSSTLPNFLNNNNGKENPTQNGELTKPLLIKPDWFVAFPWLINKNGRLRFNMYTSAKMSNVSVSKKDDLVKHQGSADHWQLLVLLKQQGLL